MISQEQRNSILQNLQPYNPIMVGIFGSFARNENKAGSDLDILVDFKETVNLMDLVGIELSLTEKLGIKVDLITKKALSPDLEKYINKDIFRIV